MTKLKQLLFITTDISVTLWILNNNKKGGKSKDRKLRDRSKEILFMDLRSWTRDEWNNAVKNMQKKKFALTSEQISKATGSIISIQIEPKAHLFTPNGVH